MKINNYKNYRLGFDIGGTFTDIVLYNTKKKEIHLHKCLTTPGDPSIGVINGIKELLKKSKFIDEKYTRLKFCGVGKGLMKRYLNKYSALTQIENICFYCKSCLACYLGYVGGCGRRKMMTIHRSGGSKIMKSIGSVSDFAILRRGVKKIMNFQ